MEPIVSPVDLVESALIMIKEALITEFTVILDDVVFLEEIAAFPSSVEITVALSCGLGELLLAMSVGT